MPNCSMNRFLAGLLLAEFIGYKPFLGYARSSWYLSLNGSKLFVADINGARDHFPQNHY